MILRPNRAGYLFGYFPLKDGVTVENEYCIYFKDTSDVISYREHPKDEQFEYLSASKYNDARFITDAIQELLHTAREGVVLKEGETDYDVPSLHTMTVNLIGTDYKTFDIFKRYFTDIEIETTEVSKNNFKTTFSNKVPQTFSYFLSLVNLFAIFAVLNSENYTYITDEMIKKYLRFINKIDAPYFIRYLFKIRMLRGETKYKNNIEVLQQTEKYKIQMEFGDTHDMRINYVKNNLAIDLPIVDIGAGIDFRYMKAYTEHLQDAGLPYYVIEIDEDARERIRAASKNRGWHNVEIFESLDDFLLQYSGERVNVLCTEVLEHNELSVAEKLVSQVVEKINYNTFVITVPNSDFNQFYGMSTEFRHNDHKWEMGAKDWDNFCLKALFPVASNGTTMVSSGVGDKVDDIPVSHGIVMRNVDYVPGIPYPKPVQQVKVKTPYVRV
jgi:hypothetical protein